MLEGWGGDVGCEVVLEEWWVIQCSSVSVVRLMRLDNCLAFTSRWI